MRSKKIFILLITISLPVILYLFLRSYGTNHYNLPYFFKDGVVDCGTETVLHKGNYTFFNHSNNDSVSTNEMFSGHLNLILFPDYANDNQPLKNELNRTFAELSDEAQIEIHIFKSLEDTLISNEPITKQQMAQNYQVDAGTLASLKQCLLALPTAQFGQLHPFEYVLEDSKTVVLVDDSLFIRGYYNAFQTKDVDRLILEVKVFLSSKNQ